MNQGNYNHAQQIGFPFTPPLVSKIQEKQAHDM